MQLGDHAAQHGVCRGIEHRRNVVGIDHQLVVGAALYHAHRANGLPLRRQRRCARQAQARLCELQHRGAERHRVAVGHLALDHAEARGRAFVFREDDFFAAGAAQRQCEHDEFVGQVARHFIRQRRIFGAERERRAIGQHAGTAKQRHAAERIGIAVDVQVKPSPIGALQARRAASDVLLDIALQLLEVLGPQVHAFGPHHTIRQRLRMGALPAGARIANCHQRTSWGVPTLKREALADVLPIDHYFSLMLHGASYVLHRISRANCSHFLATKQRN